MNGRKFCFIICAEQERELEECLWYIEKLSVPDGYETETVVIRNASSMIHGYEQATIQSDAKYKIYLHPDVFIVNHEMLLELLDVFRQPSIGMVGIVGDAEEKASGISESFGKIWDAGAVEVCNIIDTRAGNWIYDEEKKWLNVVEIDEMFMATQYDLPWESMSSDGEGHFTLSGMMRQMGYCIVVPQIAENERCWVFHDAGQCGEEDQSEEIKDSQKKVVSAFESGDFEETARLMEDLELNDQLANILLFLKVRAEEITTFGETNYPDAGKMQAFVREYDEVKHMLRRMYFGYGDAAWRELCRRVCAGQCSMKMIWQATQICVADRDRLWWDVFERYQEEIRALIREGEILLAERFILQMDKAWRGVEGNMLVTLLRAYHREIEKGVSPTVFDVFQDMDELTGHYIRLKYYMRRLEFGLPQEYWQEIYEYCMQTKVSDYLIFQILSNNIFFKEELCRNLSTLFVLIEGADSIRARVYTQLAEVNAER